MKVKFIVKPPVEEGYISEFSIFKEEFSGRIKEDLTEREGPKNAKNLAKKAFSEGFNRIVFVGGDGILNEGVNGILELFNGQIPPQLTIGIIPTGSGNNFAKALNIPKDIKEAFRIIKKSKTKTVDVGKVNDKFFVNCFSIGFDTVINKVANSLKEKYQFLPKQGSYLFAAIKEVLTEIPKFKVQVSGEEINYKGKIILIAITNGSTYGAIFKVNPGAICDDGKLNVCLVEPVGKIKALIDIYKVTQGTHVNLPEMKMFNFSSPLTISSSEPLPYELDGEVLKAKREYRVSILPRVLKVLTV